jgi:hypothetical protein
MSYRYSIALNLENTMMMYHISAFAFSSKPRGVVDLPHYIYMALIYP